VVCFSSSVSATADSRRGRGGGPRALRLALLVAASLVVPAGAAAQPAPAAPVVLDGPSPNIVAPVGLGMSVGRDGTGALVYLKEVAGVEHVFVSILSGGSFGAATQVDSSLAGASSQPVVAAGNGGLLVVAFVNGGQLYGAERTTGTTQLGAPSALFSGAANPSLQMTNFGKAYLAFTATDGAGFDVRTAYYYQGAWALEAAPLNATPADDAGSGAGRPAVAAAGDGIAIVAWGEQGHIYTRRVWGAAPSVIFERADAPPAGCSETAAGEPAIAAGGDSSYAAVAFHALLTCGAQSQSRVLVDRLHGSIYDGVVPADGLSAPASAGADQPRVAVTEYGQGWVTSSRAASGDVFAMALGANDSPGPVTQVNSLPNASPPEPIPAIAGLFSGLIAWQHDPGGSGVPEIRARYAPQGSGLGPELVLSAPSQGPTDAAAGLTGAGDVAGDAAVSWVQGSPGALRIVAEQMYQPPGAPAPANAFRYARSTTPLLGWKAAGELWGPVQYVVSIDGAQVAQTTGTSLRAPAALAQGPHRWQVTAINPAGRQTPSRPATVFVDTVAPQAHLTVTGRRRAGRVLHIYVAYTDAPPPLSPADASGIAQVVINWGDGSRFVIHHGKLHVYERPGRYKVTVVVRDRAGNATTLVAHLRIAPRHPRGHRKHRRH
jgi:hypothetical protein